jgi:DNA-binding transcriptional MerR regulator
MISYNGNGGNNNNNNNLADILQFIGQWFTVTGDTLGLIGQAMALEQDKNDTIQAQKEKQQQELQQQQMQQQIKILQEQIKKQV